MAVSKKALGIGAGIVAGTSLAYNYPEEVGQTIGAAGEAVGSILSNVGGGVNDLSNSVLSPVVGSAAPFAAPVLAGGYLGKKISDITKVENKILKGAIIGAGALAGGAASATALSPYIVGSAALVGLSKPAYNLTKRISGSVYAGLTGLLGDIVKTPINIPRNMKKGFLEPSIKPFW